MTSPYEGLPSERFWRTGVAESHPLTIENLYRKKFSISPQDRIATAGSCFAQHISVHLRKAGFTVIDAEPAPPGLSLEHARQYGYNLYSARYGTIYTTRHLLQLAREALGQFEPVDAVWQSKGRFHDAMRPTVEPNGLTSIEEVTAHRQKHLERVRGLLRTADLLIFTFGLTEGWLHAASGTVYPTAPGTVAGSYDAEIHQFKNFTFNEIYSDFCDFRRLVKLRNPKLKFLLTVSPVPLTATASEIHVLQATIYSKSVLRAVAGQLSESFEDVDYFPSYEMIASPYSRGFFYESNLRSVNDGGVSAVMRVFFSEHKPPIQDTAESEAPPRRKRQAPHSTETGTTVCEDALLEAFAK